METCLFLGALVLLSSLIFQSATNSTTSPQEVVGLVIGEPAK